LDRASLGAVSRKDFLAAFCSSEPTLSNALDLHALFDSLCVNASRGLSYHEFVAATMHGSRVRVSEARLSLVFSYLDADAKGYLSTAGLQSALGEDVSMLDLQDMIAAADDDGDQVVSKAEFIALWTRVWGPNEGIVCNRGEGNSMMDISPSPSGRYK
jgi:Ca2+-binding EF-hand superfamily protein